LGSGRRLEEEALRRKVLRCLCGARLKVLEGAVRIECKKCGRCFGEPKPPPNRTREMERWRRQEARRQQKKEKRNAGRNDH
jgi:hypothetical protein